MAPLKVADLIVRSRNITDSSLVIGIVCTIRPLQPVKAAFVSWQVLSSIT